MDYLYLIRYGLMGRVGRFSAEAPDLGRGEAVVIRSHRGTELGEVLVSLPPAQESPALPPQIGSARILRPAGPDDLERAGRADRERALRFDTCQQVFRDGVWPLELIDVEPLLDERRTVLHYLGPHRLDVEGLRAIFRDEHGLDVVLEPAGIDLPESEGETADEPAAPTCGDCGSGSGGCGTSSGCGSGHSGCDDCGVKKLIATRQPAPR